MSLNTRFLAIDFETADNGRDSACAVGLVRFVGGEIVDRKQFLIRPPRRNILYTYIHGIKWEHVKDQPNFAELWPLLEVEFRETDCLVAHNAGFDAAVLKGCCTTAGVPLPVTPFICTVVLARKAWRVYPTKLPDVCRYLDIHLKHHDALSDAEACARIVIAAQKAGRDHLIKVPSAPATPTLAKKLF
ncbi:3'-5' exonuclease [Telmatocola sphagniphila]|uniref:3'-5' exonuclease n=1 Tax=Telmatocola sphagniphila TaxID=1123043 RepID=A0A8E6B7G9_9BACT|nr:3'-5' exonuclease [Telmatocola sphagniphila]QVL32556.1 3'-5' exonuclease [Telmatocola sphagniphila]